jgi:cytochrome oxidase Cu insertion factor (SCO1/SenC/PrrC family)
MNNAENLPPQNPERREFMKKAAALSAASLVSSSDSFASIFGKKNNAFEALKDFKFKNQDGLAINGADLPQIIEGNNFTISFGFNGCGSFCPRNNAALGNLAKNFGQPIKHIVINVNPEIDGKTSASRNDYANSIIATGVEPKNLTVLYPEKNDIAAQSSMALGYTTVTNNHEQHNGFIILYDKQGNYKAQAPGNDENITNKFKAALNGHSR